MRVEISDWVQGSTDNGEFVHGFIESIEDIQGIAKVYVVNSDNEQAIGKMVSVRRSRLKKLPTVSLEDAASILNFIDMALATRDEEWFMELSAKLGSAAPKEVKAERLTSAHFTAKNRLGLYGLK
jgi:hypothetical protein